MISKGYFLLIPLKSKVINTWYKYLLFNTYVKFKDLTTTKNMHLKHRILWSGKGVRFMI